MIIVTSAPPTRDVGAYARSLAEKHKAILMDDPARALCKKLGFQTFYDVPPELQLSVREQLMREHLAALPKSGNTVCAFNVLEWAADWMRWQWGNTKADRWRRIDALIAETVLRYDVIHHVASAPAATYDGYRWLDRNNAAQIDRLLKLLYVDYGVMDKVTTVEARQ